MTDDEVMAELTSMVLEGELSGSPEDHARWSAIIAAGPGSDAWEDWKREAENDKLELGRYARMEAAWIPN